MFRYRADSQLLEPITIPVQQGSDSAKASEHIVKGSCGLPLEVIMKHLLPYTNNGEGDAWWNHNGWMGDTPVAELKSDMQMGILLSCY